MWPLPSLLRFGPVKFVGASLILAISLGICASAQLISLTPTTPGDAFAQLDYNQLYLSEQQDSERAKQQDSARQELVNSGVVSALDLRAPGKAVDEFNRGVALMKEQKSKEALRHLQRAIAVYPEFVSAHSALGLAYLDLDDPRAPTELETAAKLDDKFPGSFINLGQFALSRGDFAGAQTYFEKAVALNPRDVKTLTALAFAQNNNHKYEDTLATAQRVHGQDHQGAAIIHYLAASAAMALGNVSAVQAQLTIFLAEDPTNAMAATARRNLDALAHPKKGAANKAPRVGSATTEVKTFPNSDRLKAELASLSEEPAVAMDSNEVMADDRAGASTIPSASLPASQPTSWTIHKTVDETVLFFSVSGHGHMISDLDLSNIQLRDGGKPPERIVQFLPQSKLPLRLALVVDMSGSVQQRFEFEKHAAEKFIEKVLNGTTDLGVVAGFNLATVVAQDFSSDAQKLRGGIEQLNNSGGTALFDALSFACSKLADYPDQQRVARVVVVLTDGEDNSSHRSLKQVLREAEAAGVTIYPVSTKESSGPKTDADRILDVLAERTGGESMFPGSVFALGSYLDRLRDLIRSRYLLAYKPSGFQPDGNYRTVTISAERAGKRFQVHARKGYYARIESSHK